MVGTAQPDLSSGSGSPVASAVSLAETIAGLETLDLAALRVQFRNRTGRIAPTRIARPLLLRVLAYRLQAEGQGDLRPETRRLLARLAAGAAQNGAGEAAGAAAPAVVPARTTPQPGTVLVREWQGRMQHVMVLGAGLAWNGVTYPSLSAVALAITGTRWNGRRFFGLDRPAKVGSAAGAGGPS